ncbi:MAG TPA: glycine oxidase ThiO [Dehalococcoidia bacterium]|nr:glycine oxidase ThiO [Dehalococcoidia bacterium]
MAQRIVIVGGGAIGCSLAYHLAGAGQQVTLLERATIAAEASSAAAGMLSPVAESAHPDAFLELAVAGLRVFQEDAAAIEAVSGLSIEYVPNGVLRTANAPERSELLQSRIAWAKSAGLPVRWLSRAECLTLEPALGPAVIGGLDSPEEGQVHPRRLTQALAQGAARRGAEIREGSEVHGLLLRGGSVTGVRLSTGAAVEGDLVLLAGGAWTAFCARGAADVPVEPVKGQYAILREVPQPIRRVIYGEHAYLLPRPDGTIYLGATEEPEAGYEKRVTVAGVRGLLNAAAELAPVLERAELAATGSGLRPGSPDRLPILGFVPGVSGLAVAAGHFRNGVLLSLISGRLLTELIVHGRTSIDLTPFAPGRFAAPAGRKPKPGLRMGRAAPKPTNGRAGQRKGGNGSGAAGGHAEA